MSTKTEATIEDLYKVEGKAELVNGEIVHMPPTGGLPNQAAGEIFVSLRQYTRRTKSGHAVSDNAAFVVNLPHRNSFSPDAAFYVGEVTMKFFEGAPVFAVEVRSEAGEKLEPMPKPVREKLGRQTIDGVEAEGTRTSITIPAGVMNTERPVEITHEEWYSPELKMIVLMRHVDPRFGETTFRLTNVSCGEQDRALFYPPDGYKVVNPMRGPRGLPGRQLPPDMTPPHRRP
jgi:putative restriction endonuclease